MMKESGKPNEYLISSNQITQILNIVKDEDYRKIHEIFRSLPDSAAASKEEPDKIFGINELSEYMYARAEKLQNRGDFNSAFECLYFVTVINRGWYWDTTGRHRIRFTLNSLKEHDAATELSIKDKLLGQLIEEYESGDNSDLTDCDTTDEWYGHGWEDATEKFVKHLKDIRSEIPTPLSVPNYQSGEDHKSNVMSKKTIKAIARDHARKKGERY